MKRKLGKENWATIIFVSILLLSSAAAVYFAAIGLFFHLGFVIPIAIVLLFLWAHFVGFGNAEKSKRNARPEHDKTFSGKLALTFSNWKFWAFVIAALVIFLFVFARGAIFLATAMVGTGLLYYFGKKEVPELLEMAVQVLYWPAVFALIVTVISRRLSKRWIITLSTILLLLLISAFFGCAMLANDAAKGPW